jgi:hypothetical protein
MNVASLAIVVAALGVNFGWQPSPEDPKSYEVLMQVEPELLDVMQDGQQIPIESHVPAHVAPIRNIRVVVGTEELPRTAIAAPRNAKANATSDLIVRGQEPQPIEHTANFQGDAGWSGDRYPTSATGANRQFDQRGPSISGASSLTPEQNPWTVENAQKTAADAGNSLRSSVNSSIEDVNQQFNEQGQQALNSAQDAGRQFGQQLQDMTGFNGQSPAPPSTATSSRSSQSPWTAPPLASPQTSTQSALMAPPLNAAAGNSASRPTTTAATTNSWSSIRPELAPPRLSTPPLGNGVRVASNPAVGSPATRASAGPSFPPPPTGSAPLHSVLAPPSTVGTQANEKDWAFWGDDSTSASDHGSGGLLPVPPRVQSPSAGNQPSNFATSTASGAPATGRYDPPPPATPTGAEAFANAGQMTRNFDNRPTPQAAVQSSPQFASAPSPATIGQQQPAFQQANSLQPPAVKAEEVPWKPLLGVSLALAGSVGANFFLGMSYADARRRYRSLVSKTTHAFQKEAGIAA